MSTFRNDSQAGETVLVPTAKFMMLALGYSEAKAKRIEKNIQRRIREAGYTRVLRRKRGDE